MKTIYSIIFIFFLSLLAQKTKAQDFVFTFVNPAFGGNPYNYSWLLESASKQNKYDDEEEEDQSSGFSNDPLDRMQEELNYSILSSLTNKINSNLLNTNTDLSPGVYDLGDYTIRITEVSTGITINIKDQKTGNSTNMLIPKTAQ